MKNKILELLKKYKELISYVFFGGCTTVVNWLTYSVFVKFFSVNINLANIIAWIVSVLFAYITNKLWVFESKSFKKDTVFKEIISFFSSRALTGAFEIIMLPVLIGLGVNQKILGIEGFAAKIIVAIFVVIANYVFSKVFIFKNKDENKESFLKKHKTFKYYFYYSLLFVVCCALVFIWFYLEKKTMIWGIDGIAQHYPCLVYYSDYLKTIIKTLFQTGKLSIPMFDFSIGYGADILTSLNYYVLGDPLNLLCVFFKAKYIEYLYCGLIILRMYLSGIAFSLFARRFKKDNFSTLVASLLYSFCAFSIFAAVRHPYFINTLIYLPLVLLGVEKILKEKKPILFISMIFICAVSNFYFFYAITIMMAIYAIIRYVTLFDIKDIKTLFKYVGALVGSFAIGALMACAILIPNVFAVLASERGAASPIPVFYDPKYYSFLLTSLSSVNMYQWFIMGIGAISFISITLLFMQKKKHLDLKIAFFICVIFSLFPIFGKIFNGFSYPTNRWCFAFILLITFIVATCLPYIKNIKKKDIIIILSCLAVYLILGFLFGQKDKGTRLGLILTGVIVLALCLTTIKFNKNVFQTVVLSLCLLNIFVLGLSRYKLLNYLVEFDNFGKSIKTTTANEVSALDYVEDSEFFRFEQNPKTETHSINSAMLNNYNGTSFYLSLLNGNVSNFINEQSLTNKYNHWFKGLDSRSILDCLAGVKYFVCYDDKIKSHPFGFDLLKEVNVGNNNKAVIYQNRHFLGFSYSYDKTISEKAYKELDGIEKGQALTQGVVLSETTKKYQTADIKFDNYKPEIKIKPDKNITVDNGKYCVKDKKSFINIEFNGRKDCEIYLNIKGLKFKPYNKRECYSDSEFSSLSKDEKNEVLKKTKEFNYPNSFYLFTKFNGVSRSLRVTTEKNNWANGREDYLINLGKADDKTQNAKFIFNLPGEYTFDELDIVILPLDNAFINIDKMKNTGLKNVDISGNVIKGDIDCAKDNILCLNVPYSKGFSAFVDGKKAELKKANTMFSALELKKGHHDVKLVYQTPGIKIGLILSSIGFLSFVILIIFNIIKNKKTV